MEREIITIKCECKHKITIIDEWQEGFRFNTDEKIKCEKCNKEITINANGTLTTLE